MANETTAPGIGLAVPQPQIQSELFVSRTRAAMLFLLPKSQSEIARWLGVAVLGLLATCYMGVALAPNLSIHLATDVQEPLLAGDWRGSFGHKNVAAAMMAMTVQT